MTAPKIIRKTNDHLTPRQLEILELYSCGLMQKQIAYQLKIYRNTVQTHTDRAKGKLGAKTVTHAVVIALAKGLIKLPEVHNFNALKAGIEGQE